MIIKCTSCQGLTKFDYTISGENVVLRCLNCGGFANLSSHASHKYDDPQNSGAGSTSKELNLCKLHSIGREKSGLPVSSQVLLNALYDSEPLSFPDIAKMYGILDDGTKRYKGFISEIITSTNKMAYTFIIEKKKDEPKLVSLSSFGVKTHKTLDKLIGGFPQKGIAQLMFGDLSKKHNVSFNILAFIDAIGRGSTYADIALRYGVPNHDARIYGFIGTLIKNTNKNRLEPLFFVRTASHSDLATSNSRREFRKLPRWVVLTNKGEEVYRDIQRMRLKVEESGMYASACLPSSLHTTS